MFVRVKSVGRYQYLQIVETYRDKGKLRQRAIRTIGRLDQLSDNESVESLIQSLSRYTKESSIVITGRSKLDASALLYWKSH